MEKNVKDEKEIHGKVTKWRRDNAKWLRKRKRIEKMEVRTGEESGRVQNTDIRGAKLMKKMMEFKSALDKYYKYNKDFIVQLPEGIF